MAGLLGGGAARDRCGEASIEHRPSAHSKLGRGWRKMAQEKKEMTVREAGRKGGETVKERYGPEFYSKIGKKGGETVAERRGREFYAQIGKKGGEALKAKHGREFYAEIGRRGGETVKERHGQEYYSMIGKKGGRARKHAEKS